MRLTQKNLYRVLDVFKPGATLEFRHSAVGAFITVYIKGRINNGDSCCRVLDATLHDDATSRISCLHWGRTETMVEFKKRAEKTQQRIEKWVKEYEAK